MHTPPMSDLIESVREAVTAGDGPAETSRRVAETLGPFLGKPDLLTEEQREPDPDEYRQHVIHVETDGSYSIVSLVWLPGQITPIHDHVSWCVVGVYEGREHEHRYRLVDDDEPFLEESGRSINDTGSVAALTPPGDIHRVRNGGAGPAISMHIYGADIGKLGSSIRRRYDLPVRGDA